jgi:xylulose-5-phosphate/fructose-6-phosphate phosphoketolase
MATVATERDSLSAYGEARSTVEGAPLDPDELRLMDAYWRASLYLCLGMIYLKDNPLLRQPLTLDHLKVRLLGHWGSAPGQSLVYIHLNRPIKKYDLDAIFVSGPGPGAPAPLSNAYLEGTYSEVYPDKSEDTDATPGRTLNRGLDAALLASLYPGRMRHGSPLRPAIARPRGGTQACSK